MPSPPRPIRCGDDGLLQQFVRELSPRSRQRRFLGTFAELPPKLSRALSCVDGVRHVAFVVEEPGRDGQRLIAEGRLARNADDGSAEVALAVADAWQGLGIGSRLMAELLATAQRDSLHTVYGQLLRENRPAASLLRRFGFALELHPDDPAMLRAVAFVARPGSWRKRFSVA
jgi:acetyltransferase